MRKSLKDIYTMHISKQEEHYADLYHKEKEDKKEWDLYETLHKNLSNKDSELFNTYVDIVGFRHCDEEEKAYKDGFIAGALLMIEIFTAK